MSGLKLLFNSPMNKMISLSNMIGIPSVYASIKGKRVLMKGITKMIKNRFFPEYEYTGTESRSSEEKKACHALLPINKKRVAAAKRRKIKGVDLGNMVDYQIRLYVNNPEAFSKLGSRLHKTTKDLLTAYHVWGWELKSSQFPVAAPNFGIGTRLDAVAVDKTNNPILIENKTGFSGYLHKFNGMMRSPLQTFDNRPLNQHYLQLFIESLIVKYYWGLDFGKNMYVVIATPDGVTPYQVPSYLQKMEKCIWDAFTSYALEILSWKIHKQKMTIINKRKKLHNKDSPRKRKKI